MRESMPQIQFAAFAMLKFITFDDTRLYRRSRRDKLLKFSAMRSYSQAMVNAAVNIREHLNSLLVIVVRIVNDKCLQQFGRTGDKVPIWQ